MKSKIRINKKVLIALAIIIIFIIAFIIVINLVKPSSAKIAPTKDEIATTKLKANKVYDENIDIKLATISATKNDYSAILVKDEAVVTLRESFINKYSGIISDNTKQEEYGLNSTIAVAYGSKLKITDTKIETSTEYTNAIYVSGPKSKVELIDSNITSFAVYSNGLVSSTNGHIAVQHSDIITKFRYSPAIVVKDEKGKIDLQNNVMLETHAGDSPLFKSSGTITMTDSTGSAYKSRIGILTGGNLTITNSTIKAAGKSDNTQEDEIAAGFIIKGTDKETNVNIKNSSININDQNHYFDNTTMFDIANTKANISLDKTQLYFGSGKLLNITNSNTTLNLDNQTIKGSITIDEPSTLSINLKNSSLETQLNSLNINKNIKLSLDNNSKLILTGNIYVKELNNKNKDNTNIVFNNYKLFVNGTPIN